MTTTPTTDLDRIASDHLMHSTAADYDINADFAADMSAQRASAVADAIERDAAEQAAGRRVPWEPGSAADKTRRGIENAMGVDDLTTIADQHEDMLEWKWSIGDLAL